MLDVLIVVLMLELNERYVCCYIRLFNGVVVNDGKVICLRWRFKVRVSNFYGKVLCVDIKDSGEFKIYNSSLF